VEACRRPGSSTAPDGLGRFAGDPEGQDAWSFHAAELNAVYSLGAVRATANREDIMFSETNPTPTLGRRIVQTPHQSQRPKSMSGSGYPKFRNDRAVAEIRI